MGIEEDSRLETSGSRWAWSLFWKLRNLEGAIKKHCGHYVFFFCVKVRSIDAFAKDIGAQEESDG